jgi:hypothetical protein
VRELAARRRPRTAPRQTGVSAQAVGWRHWMAGRRASGRTRWAYRLVISNSDSIRVSDSRWGSRPRSSSAGRRANQ